MKNKSFCLWNTRGYKWELSVPHSRLVGRMIVALVLYPFRERTRVMVNSPILISGPTQGPKCCRISSEVRRSYFITVKMCYETNKTFHFVVNLSSLFYLSGPTFSREIEGQRKKQNVLNNIMSNKCDETFLTQKSKLVRKRVPKTVGEKSCMHFNNDFF